MKFSDGMEFKTDGPLRVELMSDGYYVVGDGMLMAVDSHEEGEEFIRGDHEQELAGIKSLKGRV